MPKVFADLRAFLEYHARKRTKILQLLTDINKLILRVLAEDQVLREAKASTDPLKAIQHLKSPIIRTPSKYVCPPPAEGCAIDLVPFNEEGLPLDECIRTDQLWLFWKHSRFQVVEAGEQGCSWLELFARFQFLGGKRLAEDPSSTIAQSFKKLLGIF